MRSASRVVPKTSPSSMTLVARPRPCVMASWLGDKRGYLGRPSGTLNGGGAGTHIVRPHDFYPERAGVRAAAAGRATVQSGPRSGLDERHLLRPRGDCRDSTLHKPCAGRWRGVVSLGFDADGKRLRRKAGGKTKAEVKKSSRHCTRNWTLVAGADRQDGRGEPGLAAAAPARLSPDRARRDLRRVGRSTPPG